LIIEWVALFDAGIFVIRPGSDQIVGDAPLSTLKPIFEGLLAVVPAPSGDPFWQRFLTSAGFGGLMALTAALIAARIAAQQLRHAKAQQLTERWWSTLTWVYDRAIVEQDKRAALPHHVTFAMLSQLAERAQMPPEDQLQQRAIRSILSMFEAAGKDTTNPKDQAGLTGTTFQVSDPTAIVLLDELREKLSSDAELTAKADQLRYLHAAKSVVEREAAALGAATDSRQHGNVVATWAGRDVLVTVHHAERSLSNGAVFLAIERLAADIAANYHAIGGVLVLNTPPNKPAVDEFLAKKGGPGVEVVSWREEADDPAIRDALQRLRPAEDKASPAGAHG
jgi:hypothetical protein